MKKLLGLFLPLLFVGIARADTVTSGAIGLTIISTTTRDSTGKSWGDKINENFNVISSSYSPVISSVTNHEGRIQALEATATTYVTLSSTVSSQGSRLNALDASTTTLGGPFRSTSTYLYDLVITSNSQNTNQVVVTADAINIMGCFYNNFSTTVALNLSGAGGLDTGSEAANTWYRIFAISNSLCTSTGIIVSSANVSNPTMPTGFTKWRPLGYVFNNASSNIFPIYKRGKFTRLWTDAPIASGVNPSSNTETAIDLSNYISPKAFKVVIHYINDNGTNASASEFQFRCGGTIASGSSSMEYGWQGTSTNDRFAPRGRLTETTNGSRTCYYSERAGLNFSVALDLFLIGYEEEE